jgi:hypothetical protein
VEIDDGGTQSYHGLLLSATWRIKGLSVAGNYTWSHCIGFPITTLQTYSAAYQHAPGQVSGPVNRRLDYSDCISPLPDIRQIANITVVANTPTFSNVWVRRLASGWTFSSIISTRTGSALIPNLGSDGALDGIFASSGTFPIPQRPQQVLLDVAAPNQGQSCSFAPCVSWFNPAAFATPAVGTLSNMAIAPLRGPGFWEWDQMVSRQFQVTERQRVEFRVEAFNVTNSVRLGNPSLVFSSLSSFGRITSDVGPRIMQLALKYVF